MTPVTQVVVPGQTATAQGTVQMAKIAPATTALPTQLTTVRPASTITAGVAVAQPGSTVTKTIRPQTSLQQVQQTHNVLISPANMQKIQRPVAEVGESLIQTVKFNSNYNPLRKCKNIPTLIVSKMAVTGLIQCMMNQ